MKKIVLALLCVSMLALTACSSDCKASGCDRETYEDGYCDLHYFKKAGEEFVNNMMDLG